VSRGSYFSATLPGLTKPPLPHTPFDACHASTTRSIEREFCLSLDCTVSMKFIAFSDSGTAEYFSGSERWETVSLYFFFGKRCSLLPCEATLEYKKKLPEDWELKVNNRNVTTFAAFFVNPV